MSNTIAYTLIGIWLLLAAASIVVFIITRRKPEADLSELMARTKSWWVMLGVFTFAIVISPLTSILFLAFVSFMAFKEYLSMIPSRRADRRTLLWAYLMIPIQYYWVSIHWYGMFIVFIPVYGFLFLPFRLLLSRDTQGFLKSIGTIQWGLMLTVYAVSHAAFLLTLPKLPGGGQGGAGLMLFLVLLTQLNDVAQYVWGKLYGKHKVIPEISPKKTWEGLLGGIGTTCVLGLILYPFLTPFTFPLALGASLMIGVAGFIGDVTVSAVKRDLGVKDASNLIPGHGGILDRIDSLTYTAPLFFHYTYYFMY